MARKIDDMSGQKVGMLTVLRDSGLRQAGSAVYVCKCDCGREVNKSRQALRNGQAGNQRSHCGCLGWGKYEGGKHLVSSFKQSPFAPLPSPPDRSVDNLFASYKSAAKKRNYGWELSKDEFKRITKMNCAYCEVEPKQSHTNLGSTPYIYNGIDRKDNTQGYTISNVVPCCGVCNRMKNAMSEADFLSHIRKIASVIIRQ